MHGTLFDRLLRLGLRAVSLHLCRANGGGWKEGMREGVRPEIELGWLSLQYSGMGVRRGTSILFLFPLLPLPLLFLVDKY